VSVRLAFLAACVLLVACTDERRVLEDPEGLVSSCANAFAEPAGAPCVLAGRCERAASSNPLCCTEVATCSAHALVLTTECDPACDCDSDGDCPFGQATCGEIRCEPCAPTSLCPACPAGWVRLERNGCDTCQCGPPSACMTPGEACGADQVCYAGQSCASGCDATVEGCCSNACAASGCLGDAPVGCHTPCTDGCTSCATSTCRCEARTWVCDSICAEDVPLVCTYP
jgi:hypothetical protein